MVAVKGSVAEFYFYRPQARQVFLVGDFNGWRQQDLAMSRDRQGCWKAQLHLPPGEYKFRYLADGRWYTDYAAFGVKEGAFGLDSVLWVPPAQEPRRSPESAGERRRSRGPARTAGVPLVSTGVIA